MDIYMYIYVGVCLVSLCFILVSNLLIFFTLYPLYIAVFLIINISLFFIFYLTVFFLYDIVGKWTLHFNVGVDGYTCLELLN